MLRILNSQSRQKEEFKPLNPGRVTMYTCGPTVYDSLHLGHARAAITPDVVRRYLEYKGFNVRYATNFTDVDDKIIKRAIADGVDYREITARYIDEYHRLMLALNIKPADVYPRATDHIPEMIEIVQRLLEKNHAYAASDGDIYFDTSTCAHYGALSGRKLEEEEAGLSGRIAQARLAVKKNPGDFVLWKLNKNDREEIAKGGNLVPRWPSPWGDGRPGWHLECSAMSRKYLGVPFDIHAGGMDLLFPHHEDEKAQTECAYPDEVCGKDSVRYWVHNAFITAKKRPEDVAVSPDLLDAATGSVKMSKSLGNVKWLREMIWPDGSYDPMAVRMMILSSHYRSPIVFEPAMLDEAQARLDRLYNTLEALGRVMSLLIGAIRAKDSSVTSRAIQIQPGVHALPTPESEPRIELAEKALTQFGDAMDDDFNSAGALGTVFELIGAVNQELAKHPPLAGVSLEESMGFSRVYGVLVFMLTILGIRPHRAKAGGAGDSEKLVELLLQTRQEARKAKQFALSDKIRADLTALGYEVEDLPGGKSVAKKK